MTDVFEIAMERRATLMAEIAEVDDFIHKAESWWKSMAPAQKKNAAPDASPHFEPSDILEAIAA